MSETNNNPTNDAFENLRNMIQKLENQISSIKSNMPPDPKNPQNVWANPKNHQFVDNPINAAWFPPMPPQMMPPQMMPPQMPHQMPPQPPQVAPDVAQFISMAEVLLFNAMYLPFSRGASRLSDFFGLVLQAKARMSREDFTDQDRQAFANWCKQIGNIIDISQSKGVWLLDDEREFVHSMATGNVWNYEGGPDSDEGFDGEGEFQ